MTSMQLDELEKAQRSMRVTIFNNTSRTLVRHKVIVHSGMFRVQVLNLYLHYYHYLLW